MNTNLLNTIIPKQLIHFKPNLIQNEVTSYELCKLSFESLFKNLLENPDHSITDTWLERNKILENFFLPYPPFDFLNHPIVIQAMFVDNPPYINEEIEYLERKIHKHLLIYLLKENFFGKPHIVNQEYETSGNTIHHLYHITNYIDKTAIDFNGPKILLEWGAGYGNMAKLLKKINNNLTYILVDTNIFSCLQWLYLSVVLGQNEVVFVNKDSKRIERNKVNILPISVLNNLDIKIDFFISTWGISESSQESQKYLSSKNFYNAKHFLVAYQAKSDKFPFADNIKNLIADDFLYHEKINVLPGNNYYLFK